MQLADANGFRIESQVAAELLQNFRAVALGHRLGDEIADAVRKQRIAPEHLHAGGLVREMRLMRQHDGHQPIRVLERHQAARARLIAAELSHPIEEGGVLQRDGERLPTGLRDRTVEGRGIAELRPPFASFSQRVQPPLSALVSFAGALVIEPRLEASVMEPFCRKTRSPSFTAITSLLPCRRQWMPVTTNLPRSVV